MVRRNCFRPMGTFMTIANIVCIKWGTKFPPYYVNRLYAGVARGLKRPFRFVCFTEHQEGIRDEVEVHPLPLVPFEKPMVEAMTTGKRRGAWRKVTMMKPGSIGLKGPTLVMDLDVIVTGSLDELFEVSPGKVCMGREWRYKYQPWRGVAGHGSVYRFEPGRHDYLYTDFEADVEGSIAFRGEQKYITKTAHRHGDFAYFPDGWICSFKRQAIPIVPFNLIKEPVLPKSSRVMCFHGDPKMEEALIGEGSKLKYRTKPASWLRQLWLEDHERNWMP